MLVAVNSVATIAGIAEPVERQNYHILVLRLRRFVGCGARVHQFLREFDEIGALQRHFLSVREQAARHRDQCRGFRDGDGAILDHGPLFVVLRRRLRDTKQDVGIGQHDSAHHLFQSPDRNWLISRSLRNGRPTEKQNESETHFPILA